MQIMPIISDEIKIKQVHMINEVLSIKIDISICLSLKRHNHTGNVKHKITIQTYELRGVHLCQCCGTTDH